MVSDAKVRWAGGHGSSPTANTQNAAGELPSAFCSAASCSCYANAPVCPYANCNQAPRSGRQRQRRQTRLQQRRAAWRQLVRPNRAFQQYPQTWLPILLFGTMCVSWHGRWQRPRPTTTAFERARCCPKRNFIGSASLVSLMSSTPTSEAPLHCACLFPAVLFLCNPLFLPSVHHQPGVDRTELATLEETLAVKKSELRTQVHTQGLPHARLWGNAYPGWIVSEGPGLGPSDKGEPGGCTSTWGPNQEPCGMACLPLSTFCHECILNDPSQVYKKCDNEAYVQSQKVNPRNTFFEENHWQPSVKLQNILHSGFWLRSLRWMRRRTVTGARGGDGLQLRAVARHPGTFAEGGETANNQDRPPAKTARLPDNLAGARRRRGSELPCATSSQPNQGEIRLFSPPVTTPHPGNKVVCQSGGRPCSPNARQRGVPTQLCSIQSPSLRLLIGHPYIHLYLSPPRAGPADKCDCERPTLPTLSAWQSSMLILRRH